MTAWRRWLGTNSEDVSTRVITAFLVLGFLAAPFYRTDVVRDELLGDATPTPLATLAVLCLALALALRSLLRRDVPWFDPARLTWADFDGSRPRLLAWQLARGWTGRFAVVGYVTSVSALLVGAPAAELALCGALFVGVALLAQAMIFRQPHPRMRLAEQLVPLPLVGLAIAAISPAASAFGLPALWTIAGMATLGAICLWLAPGTLITTGSGRVELVRRFTERMMRRMSLSFLDVWALLPAGRPGAPARALSGRAVLARFMLVGILTRRRSLVTVALLAVTAALMHAVFPAVNPVWWVAVGGFLAGLPFASQVAVLFRNQGLRRWLGCSDRALKLAALGMLTLVLTAWLGVTAVLGVPLSLRAGLAILLAVAAVIRTVTRRRMNFSDLGLVSVMGVLVPAGLLAQLAHGPDLLLVGAVLLAAGIAVSISGPIVLGLSAASTLR